MKIFFHIAHVYGFYVFEGATLTLRIAGGAMLVALVVGFVLAVARMSGWAILYVPARLYVDLIRGTPPLLHLFLVYFSLPAIGIRLSGVDAATLAFGFSGAAYMAEIYRSGIISVGRDQRDSAAALGMSARTTMRSIILPQAIPIMLPPTTNFAIGLTKESSLALIVAVPEIMYRTYTAINVTFQSGSLLVIAAGAYLTITVPLMLLTSYLERRVKLARA